MDPYSPHATDSRAVTRYHDICEQLLVVLVVVRSDGGGSLTHHHQQQEQEEEARKNNNKKQSPSCLSSEKNQCQHHPREDHGPRPLHIATSIE